MTAKSVTVIDAGVGNLGNVERAVRSLGYEPTRTDDPDVVAASRRLLLPGVGAFRPPRERLRGALEESIRHSLGEGGVLMGICVGYQLLFESSEEFGETDGLGLLQGHIRELPTTVPVPHIGWNEINIERSHPMLSEIESGDEFYFVHSYYARPVREENVFGTTDYGDINFCSIIGKDNLFATQFHLEKSGELGLKLLSAFKCWSV